MSGAARAGRGTYTYIGVVDQVSGRMPTDQQILKIQNAAAW